MTCEMLRDRLDDFLDGRLPGPVADEVRTHLEGCAECRLDLDSARAVQPMVATLPRSVAPSRSLWEGIEKRMVTAPSRRRWARWMLPLAAGIAVVAGGRFLIPRAPSVEPASTPAPVVAQVAALRAAAGELATAVLSDQASLTPVAAQAVRRDLEALDGAIQETGLALEKDPANPTLQVLMLSAHRKKLDVLRQASALAVKG